MIIFVRDTPSHNAWVRFVNQIPGSLDNVRKWLAHRYQAHLNVNLPSSNMDTWGIKFPDAETRVAFELTWLSDHGP